jgi:hypothetical protein
MKTTELIQQITAGKSVVTGRLQTYIVQQTEKAGVNEKFGILVGSRVLDFTVWSPKGTKLESVKRPPFVDKPGIVVVALGANIAVDGKYLRTGAESVSAIEP